MRNSRGQPAIHGHRGARGLYPENTLSAIAGAIDLGCEAVEVDLCVSADDHLVVVHDPVLSGAKVRGPDGNWIGEEIRVRDLELDDLQSFDVGRLDPSHGYASVYPQQKPVDGEIIPTLDEMAELVLGMSPSVVFNLEMKSTPYDPGTMPDPDHYAGLMVGAINRLGISDRVLLQSFDWRLSQAVVSRIDLLGVAVTTDQQPDGDPISPVAGHPNLWTGDRDLAEYVNVPEMVASAGVDTWSSNHLDLDEGLVNRAHELGLLVCAWTVNDEADIRKMLAIGVDAITTDYPDRAIEIRNELSG